MEDMARLALVEQNIRDATKFSKILYELLRHINYILENPYDYELRTIRSEVLKKVLQQDSFVDYLKSIGFQPIGTDYTYPKENTLSNLRMAQAAIERKIYFCCGSFSYDEIKVKSAQNLLQAKKPKLTPGKILATNNPLLLKIESMFNHMIVYEDEQLQAAARGLVPLVTLQLMALDRMRDHQRKIKAGEVKGQDMPFDMALLMELLGWFKYKFFTWVDRPACDACGGPTRHAGNSIMETSTESCRVELYECTRCKGTAEFPRYNDLRTLLRTRRGRCGEWANCFTLLCRALGYDARYVYDTTDHVWCEVFDYDSNTWVHVDPCEGQLDAPLTYSCGWGKRLSYVIALSAEDLQDVTWRYTTHHGEVLKRRSQCSEAELVSGIVALRSHRQRQVSDARRRYLARRCLQELVQLMVERKPDDYESRGRISGSKEWRSERGEIGARRGHVFAFDKPGSYALQYHSPTDKYKVSGGGADRELAAWASGVFQCSGIFRKVEHDWRMTYLAREEGESTGTISWKLATTGDLFITSLSIELSSTVFEDGTVEWTIAFDANEPVPTKFGDGSVTFTQRCRSVSLAARLRGGRGAAAWQHAELFRAPLDAPTPSMHIQILVEQ